MQTLDLSHIDNLAITGANGFVGRSIVEYIGKLPFKNLPRRLTLITRQGLNFELPPNLVDLSEIVSHDLTHPWNFSSNITHFLNLAADGSKDPYSDEASIQFTTISKNLVNWIKGASTSIRVFHASSGACYGIKPVNKKFPPLNNKDKFIKSRLDVENHLIENSSKIGFELCIGRLFSFSGRHIIAKPQYALSGFISSAITSGQIYVTGDSQTQRSYLHQDSMSNWILNAIVSQENSIDLQIGSSEAVTIQELAEYVAENTNASVEYTPFPMAGDIYIPDNRETRIKLGVNEGMHWKEAVLEMISEARKINDNR